MFSLELLLELFLNWSFETFTCDHTVLGGWLTLDSFQLWTVDADGLWKHFNFCAVSLSLWEDNHTTACNDEARAWKFFRYPALPALEWVWFGKFLALTGVLWGQWIGHLVQYRLLQLALRWTIFLWVQRMLKERTWCSTGCFMDWGASQSFRWCCSSQQLGLRKNSPPHEKSLRSDFLSCHLI